MRESGGEGSRGGEGGEGTGKRGRRKDDIGKDVAHHGVHEVVGTAGGPELKKNAGKRRKTAQ